MHWNRIFFTHSCIVVLLLPFANAELIFEDFPLVPGLARAHGILMGLSFAVFFPLGALLLRAIKGKWAVRAHVACQMLGWICMLAGLGTGIRLASIIDYVWLRSRLAPWTTFQLTFLK